MYIYAEDITIVTQNFRGITEKWGEDQIGGIAGEIISKAFEAKKLTFKVIWMPWKRSQDETLLNNNKKTFIIPFTRNSEREPKYKWVAKLYNADTVFITYNGSKKINKMSNAKGKEIGVLLSSSYELGLLSEKSGLNKENIHSFPNNDVIIKKLSSGSIFAWYTGIIGAISVIKDEKMDVEKFNFGNRIDTDENYIATSKETSKDLVRKISSAIENFKKTSDYAEIIRKYTGKYNFKNPKNK